jgi:hypothetical protein
VAIPLRRLVDLAASVDEHWREWRDTSSRAANWPRVGSGDRGCYLPREVFFGRLGFAGAFFTVWASDFGRFLPATSDSFPMDVLPGAPYRASPACAAGRLPPGHGLCLAVQADLLETVGRARYKR